jgi:hypothetical protein
MTYPYVSLKYSVTDFIVPLSSTGNLQEELIVNLVASIQNTHDYFDLFQTPSNCKLKR